MGTDPKRTVRRDDLVSEAPRARKQHLAVCRLGKIREFRLRGSAYASVVRLVRSV
jgi:hypothetical protein